jgi:flagellar motor switch protein FliN/FliY
MPNPEITPSTKTVHWLMEEWARRLAEAVESMTQERPAAAWNPTGGRPPDSERPSSWECPLDIAPGAALYVAAPEDAWREIGARALTAAGMEGGDPETTRGTFVEILNQALAGLARSIESRNGSALTLGSLRERPALPEVSKWHLTEVRLGNSVPLAIFLSFSPAVEEAVLGLADETPAAESAEAALPVKPDSRTLDLLMDVELPVSVSFGRAELLLKDVLKLATGSIVELNRSISEPVEVAVNNCVIARGEVVVVEGNYGIKISQIVGREDRLRTLQ